MTNDETRRIARAHGLDRLSDEHLEQFAATIEHGRKIATQLPRDLHWSEELALTFDLTKFAGASK